MKTTQTQYIKKLTSGRKPSVWPRILVATFILGAPLPGSAQSNPLENCPRIRGIAPGQDGKLKIEAAVPASQRYVLQSSPDMSRWRQVAGLRTFDGNNASADLGAPTGEQGFYRLAREVAMFRNNPQHTGVSDTEGVTNTPTLKWKFKTAKGIFSSPAVLGGVVYIGSLDTNFYALDAETGAEKWRFRTAGPIRSSPAVVDGMVYGYSRDGFLYALNAANGEENWRCKIAETNQTKSFDNWEYFDSSPTVVDQSVYIGSGDKQMYAIDIRTGIPIWTFLAKGKVCSPPAVFGGKVFFGVVDGNFYALDAATGTNLWKFKTQGNPNNGYPNGDVLHAPVVADGIVYFGSRDSAVYAVDTVTGKKIWRTPIMGGNNWAANSPTVWKDTLLIGSSITGALTALDTKTGKQKWSLATYSNLAEYSSPVVAEGVAYFGIGDVQGTTTETALPKVAPGYVQTVDLATHKAIWRFRVDGHVWSSPAVVDGSIYFGCLDGCVYALK